MNKKTFPYFLIYAVVLLLAIWLLLSYPKAELHLLLNSCHNDAADTFFKYYTLLAEWPLYVIALIPLLFHKWRWTLWYALSEGVAAIIVRLLKILFHEPRPASYFADLHIPLPVVEGVKLHHSNSFPSGHASTFFLFFTFAALLLADYYSRERETLRPVLRNTAVQQCSLLMLLVMAVTGCYSRVYLSMHFLSDVTVGSVIGVVVATVMFCIFRDRIMKI